MCPLWRIKLNLSQSIHPLDGTCTSENWCVREEIDKRNTDPGKKDKTRTAVFTPGKAEFRRKGTREGQEDLRFFVKLKLAIF